MYKWQQVLILICIISSLACIYWFAFTKEDFHFESDSCPAIRIRGYSRNTSVTGIPKIIHQTWKTEDVPRDFKAWIKSWQTINPQREYWFWTDKDVQHLLKQHYPHNLGMFNKYPSGIFRGDAMRYFVLYHFGGVYADLDVEAIRPMDDLLDKHGCLFSYENYEHTYFHYNQAIPFVMNAIMACKPRHIFFKNLIQALPENAHFKLVLNATGPFFVTHVYNEYIKTSVSQRPSNSISLLHPKFLLPTFDKGRTSQFKRQCSLPQKGARKVLCEWQKKDQWRN